MVSATAGSGLLIAAAGAAPAYAAAPAAPPGSHTITITAHPAAGAATGIGPRAILPCAVKPGAAIKPASCLPQTITCWIGAPTPGITFPDGYTPHTGNLHHSTDRAIGSNACGGGGAINAPAFS